MRKPKAWQIYIDHAADLWLLHHKYGRMKKMERQINRPEGDVTEVSLDTFPGIRVGQTENTEAGTGLTVMISEDPDGMAAGLHIGGGGPATRETGILDPITTAQRIHAAVLGGGSAFGLDAAGGVMKYLEEKGIGVTVLDIHVPLVTQVDIFDLAVGDSRVRPDQEMGYAACKMSEKGVRGNFRSGNYGAGCGATIGKYAGRDGVMKSGIGSCVLRHGDLLVGAIISVNALGDVYDWKTGQKVAGAYAEDGRFYDSREMITFLRKMEEARDGAARAEGSSGGTGGVVLPKAALNTTIGIVFTNAPFKKPELCKIAAMAHDGFARSIAPVHTAGDGDSIIAVSVNSAYKEPGAKTDDRDGEQGLTASAGIDTVGSLAAWASSEAILRAVRSAASAYGFRALQDMEK